MRAITRKPGDLTRCVLTHVERTELDPARAREQHGAYEELLRELGVEVLSLPPEPELPDSVFVEDAAVVLDEAAVLTHMGASSRRLESASVAAALQPFRPLVRLEPPGTLDGGDVLRVGRTLFVGLSSRTNDVGLETLRGAVSAWGYDVRPVRVRGCLHLKTACTAITARTLLVNSHWIDVATLGDFETIEVAANEAAAANVLRVREALVAFSRFRRTNAHLRELGYDVRELDGSELLKAEAGPTCCCLLFE